MHNGGMAIHTHDLFSEDQAAWLEDLHEDLLCLVLHSTSAQLLLETSQNLQTLWRQAQAGQIEIFDGQHCQDIIRRFNEQVAAYSASIAALPPDPERPAHLWVVQQAQALSADQVHLLGQMLVHLPGVNIRFVLLHEGESTVANWNEATNGLADTHELVPAPAVQDPPIDMLDFASERDDAPPLPQTAAPHVQVLTTQGKWMLLGAAGLAIFALGFAIGRLSTPTTQTDPATKLDIAHIPAPTEPASAVVQTSSDTSPKATDSASPTTATTSPHAQHPRLADMLWLRKLPVNSFVVMHDTFTDESAAKSFMSKHAILKTARLVPIKVTDAVRYAVISGPFRSEERTRGFMSRLNWKKSARVLPRQQVIDDMNAALND